MTEREIAARSFEKNPLTATCDDGTFRLDSELENREKVKKKKRKSEKNAAICPQQRSEGVTRALLSEFRGPGTQHYLGILAGAIVATLSAPKS